MTTTSVKVPFHATKPEIRTAVIYLLSLAAYGLNFYPAIAVTLIMLVNSFRKNRYDFLIQFTLLLGGYALTSGNKNFGGFKPDDLALLLSFGLMFVVRKTKVVKLLLVATALYFLVILLLATTSDEMLSVQFLRIRNYFGFIYFCVPLALFARREFDLMQLFQRLILYTLVLCAFYIADAFILQGHILVSAAAGGSDSFFWDPTIFRGRQRIYPPGLYWMALCIIPVARCYTLNRWQWLLVLGAFLATLTMSFLVGILGGFLVAQPNRRRIAKYCLIGAVAFVCLYFVDRATGGNMRISTTIDPIIEFRLPEEVLTEDDVTDDITIGSGRLRQAIPKFELLYDEDREWTGLGFLHPEKTKATKFIIDNNYYVDMSYNQEVATGIEVCILQTILDCGYLGLAMQIFTFLFIGWILRRQPWCMYYWNALLVFSLFGIGGFGGLIYPHTLLLLGIAIAVAIMGQKPTQPAPDDAEQQSALPSTDAAATGSQPYYP